MFRLTALLLLFSTTTAYAQTKLTELKRADLTGTNMEVIISVAEVPPGNTLARHFHHGEEAVYILEAATIQLPDGKELPLQAGGAVINVREVPHGGFKVAGDKPLKMVTVHIIDKGKPFSEPAN